MITSPFGTFFQSGTAMQPQDLLAGHGSSAAGLPVSATFASLATQGQSDQQQGLDFSALVLRARPQGTAQPAAYESIGLPSGQDTGDAALADFVTELDALLASLVADPGEAPELDAVTGFLGILHQFDLETGADATELLAARLAQLDAQGRAILDQAAQDPITLVAALTILADIPEQSAHVVLPLRPVALEQPMAQLASRLAFEQTTPAAEQVSARIVTDAPTVTSFAGQGGNVSALIREAQADTRTLVLSVIAQNVASTEREGQIVSVPGGEARHVTGSFADALRPAATPPPAAPATGFARNLVQQIRSASFSEGQTRIALAPRGLGEIEIDMRPDEAGRLRIVLRAENPAVLQALRGDRDGLLAALSESGATTDDADLDFEDFSRRPSRQTEESEHRPHGASAIEAEDQPPLNPSPSQPIIGDGALDILT